MTYRPSFDRGEVWKPVQAIVPTAALVAIVAGIMAGAHVAALYSLPNLVPQASTAQEFLAALWDDPILIALALATIVVTIILTVMVATLPAFVVLAGVLIVFGLPVAWLLGRHVRLPAASLLALGAAGVTAYLLFGEPLLAGRGSAWFALMVAALAALTGLLYRHFVIAFRDEDELIA